MRFIHPGHSRAPLHNGRICRHRACCQPRTALPLPLPPPPPVAEEGNVVPAVAPLAPTVFPQAKLPTGPKVIVLFNVVDPLKVVVPEKVEVPLCVKVLPEPKLIVPLPVKLVVETVVKDPAPDELI